MTDARTERELFILKVAQECFLENGIANTTMKDIANACELSRQTLYKYFSSIDNLMLELQIKIMSDLEKFFEKNSKRTLDGQKIDAVRNILLTFFEYYEGHPNDIRYICLFDSYYRKEPKNELVEGYKRGFEFIKNFPQIIEDAQAQGIIRKDLNPEIIEWVIINTTAGIAQRMSMVGYNFILNSQIPKNELYNGILDMFFCYLKP